MEEFPEGFDLAKLLAPIPGAAPAGSDPRLDSSPQSLYYRLRDARAEARADERRLESPDPASEEPLPPWPPPQWRVIRELAEQALAGTAKDLEIAAWLTEALLRSDGLGGLAAGVRVMTGLVEGFWEDLFPLPEEGIATRVRPIAGLNGEGRDGALIPPLRRIVLFHRPDDGAPFTFEAYEKSERLAGIADAALRERRIAAGDVPLEAVESEARRIAGGHFATLLRQAEAAVAAWQALGAALQSRAGAEAPPMGRVQELLERIAAIAKRLAAIVGAETAPAPAAAPAAAGAAVPSSAHGPGDPLPTLAAGGGPGSREEALRALEAIAEYFRRTEPVSPLAYTLQEAARRARLSWPQLLEEIVPDAATRAAILTSLGIRPPSE
jgi:type VI secretion system protein ImpA